MGGIDSVAVGNAAWKEVTHSCLDRWSMQLCPRGQRDQGGPSSLGSEIHGEYIPERKDDWSYLHVFSFPDLKKRLN